MQSRNRNCLGTLLILLTLSACGSTPREDATESPAPEVSAEPQKQPAEVSPATRAGVPATPKAPSAISAVNNAPPVQGAPPRGLSPKLSAQARELSFSAMEQGLLSARPLHIEYAITASGAMTADVSGHLWLTPEGLLDLTATGQFNGKPLKANLRSNGAAFRLALGDQTKMQQAPQSLNPAVAIGISRMGLLHNIAMASGGQAPDHSAGGVAEWVTVGNFRGTPNAAASSVSHRFDIDVDGQAAGFADLVLRDGLPQSRYQEVKFPGGIMKVTETYRVVEVNRPAPAEAFTIE